MSASSQAGAAAPGMSERATALAMTALTMAMFVAYMSNTVVLTAMPRIVAAIHGTEADYTWIVTMSVLTLTLSIPIWGRLSDVGDKKRLIELCVCLYLVSSLVAALAHAAWQVVLGRFGIGIAAGGIIALLQAISVDLLAPRARAKWIGYRSAALSVATLGAPTIGGFVTDHLGWRCCFLVGLPFAAVAIPMLEATLRLPRPVAGKPFRLDWPGTILLALAMLGLMLYVSTIGLHDGWTSAVGLEFVGASALLLAAAAFFELRSKAPLVPLSLLANRDILLCVLASAGSGTTLFCSAVYLAVYLQTGRGLSPSAAGAMAIPEAAGTLLGALVASRLIARTGRYRPVLIGATTLVMCSFLLLSTLGADTPLPLVAFYVAMAGIGLGGFAENLVLVAQTARGGTSPGLAGALVLFARTLNAAFCVSLSGALLSISRMHFLRAAGLASLATYQEPRLQSLAPPTRRVVEAAYAHGVAHLYFLCLPAALLSLLCVCGLRGRALEP